MAMASTKDGQTLGSGLNTKTPGIMRTPLGEFQIGKTLGEGSYGKVKLIVNVKTQEKLAVKIIRRFIPPDPETGNKGRGGKTFEQRILREANLTRFLRHEHIVPLKDCRITKSHFYLFHEYISGCQLTDKIGRQGLKVETAAHYFEQIIDAIGYCHANFVVHRDIKVENIMIDKENNVKIIDFGLANFFDQKNALKTFCGSLQYSAPEIMRGDPYIGPEVDIWSIGVVLFAMLTGTLPFDDPRNPGAWECVMNGKIRWPPTMAASPKSLITRLLDPNPQRRIVMPEIVRHPFMAKHSPAANAQYKPTSHRTLPLKLDMSIVSEMTACMFQSEYAILQQLESEMKKGKEQEGLILVNNSPLVAVYHLITNTRTSTQNSELSQQRQSASLEPQLPTEPKTPKMPAQLPTLAPVNKNPVIVHRPKDEERIIAVKKHQVVVSAHQVEEEVKIPADSSVPLEVTKVEQEEKMLTNLTRRMAMVDSRRRRSNTVGDETAEAYTLGETKEHAELTRTFSNQPATMERERSGGESKSTNGTWNKESYKAKRASMYETYRRMQLDVNTLPDNQDNNQVGTGTQRKREIFRSKRASMFEGMYDMAKEEAHTISDNQTVQEIETFEEAQVHESIASQEEIEAEYDEGGLKSLGGRKDSVKRRVTVYKLGRKATVRRKSSKQELQEKNEVLAEKREQAKAKARTHLNDKVGATMAKKEVLQNDSDKIERRNQDQTLLGATKDSDFESDKEQNTLDQVSNPTNHSSTPKSETHGQTELRSPFLHTSPLLVSPISNVRPIDRTKPMSSLKASASTQRNDEPLVLPIISNQKKYLDKLLNNYRSKVNDSHKSGGENSDSGSQVSQPVVSSPPTGKAQNSELDPSPRFTSRIKKRVTFVDQASVNQQGEDYSYEASYSTTKNETEEIQTNANFIPNNNKANEIFNSLRQTQSDDEISEGSDDEAPQKVNDVKPEIKKGKIDMDFTNDGKIGIFKSPKPLPNEIVDDLAASEAKAALNSKSPKPLDLQIHRVEIDAATSDVSSAITSLLKPSMKNALPTIPKIQQTPISTQFREEELIPGVRQISITDCLKSEVVKIAKMNISSLCDQFLDSLTSVGVEYDWAETAFEFELQIPAHLVPETILSTTLREDSNFLVNVEIVHVNRAKSAAILIQSCSLGTTPAHNVTSDYPQRIKKFLSLII